MKSLTLCKFNPKRLSEYPNTFPFTENQQLLYVGEITNMPGHCFVIDCKTGSNIIGYHTDDFVELTEDEV